ncbi:MAG: MFS transporter [Chromatiales bacterium]|nr:MFS transporter [Chromatiales bacterium]
MSSMFNRLNVLVRPEGHVFYGWWIVLSSAGVHLLSSLLWMQSYGAYVVLLEDEFGWSKTQVAGAFALTRIESGLLGPLQGWLVDRFGPRIVLRIGMVMFGVGFMLFSQVENIYTFYLTFALIAVGSSLGGFATVMVAVVSWFSRHRSKAVAVSQLGFSIGGLCVPIVVLALESFGWRWTAFASGVLVIVVGLPLAQIFRHRPDAFGEVVDGIRDADAPKGRSGEGQVQPPQRDLTAKEALRTRAFWFISLGHALALLTVSCLMVHLISHLTQGPLGMSLTAASSIVALMTATQVSGVLTGGFMGDRVNKRYTCAACLAAHATGLTVIAYSTSLWMVVAGVVVHGFGWGVRGPLMTAMRADYFGASSFGTIMGLSSLIVMFGMSTGPIFAGYMADITGNYQLGFTILAGGSLLGAFCFMAATVPTQHNARAATSS